MKLSDLKIAWRLFIREPGYSAIIIAMLSLGFAACFLLLGYASYSLNYDQHVADADHLFLVKQRINAFPRPSWMDMQFMPMKKIADESGLVLDSTSIFPLPKTVRIDAQALQALDMIAVDTHFPRLFSVETTAGDLLQSLAKPDGLALSEKAAQRLFGERLALGKTLTIDGNSYRVKAILKDTPSNTSLKYEAVVGINSAAFLYKDRQEIMTSWDWMAGKFYLKLAPKTSPSLLEKILQDALNASPWAKSRKPAFLQNLGTKKLADIRLTALSEAYFDQDLGNVSDFAKQVHGDKRTVFGLVAVGLLVLILAMTNYVNLAVVRTLGRQREIGVLKLLGASRTRLFARFFAEAMLSALIATGCGLVLAWLLLPIFSDCVNRPLDNLFTAKNLILSALLGVLVAVLAAAYPTWLACQLNVNQALTGRCDHESIGGMLFRRVLTVGQFSIGMSLVAVTLAITWQTYFSTRLSLGFNPDQIFVLHLDAPLSTPKSSAFRDALLRLPSVHAVAGSSQPLGRDFVGRNSILTRSDGKFTMADRQNVSSGFFELHEVRAKAGRLYQSKRDTISGNSSNNSGDSTVVINEAAATSLGYVSPEAAVGEFLTWEAGGVQVASQIVGVSPNLRYQGSREKERARFYRLNHDAQAMSIKIKGDMASAQKQIALLSAQYFPNELVEITSSTTLIAKNSEEDIRISTLLIAASILSLTIAAFGIYVLSSYSTQRRRREIAIRKIYGAKGSAIAFLVGKEFVSVMLISALIGLPIGAYAIAHYLASFAERAPIGAWTLLLALGVSVMIAFASTLRHSLLAIKMSPASILRN